MPKLTDEDLRILAGMIAKHYPKPEVERVRLPTKKKTIQKTITVQEEEEVTEEVDKGCGIPGLLTLILGNALVGTMLGLYFLSGYQVVIPEVLYGALAAVNVAGILLCRKYRRIVTVTSTVLKPKEKTVTTEIEEPPQYERKRIPNPTAVRAIGRLSLSFRVVDVLGGRLVTAGDDWPRREGFSIAALNDPGKARSRVGEMESLAEQVPHVLGGSKGAYPISAKTAYGDSIVLRGLERDIQAAAGEINEIFSDLTTKEFGIPLVRDPAIISNLRRLPTAGQVGPATEELLGYMASEDGTAFDQLADDWLKTWEVRMETLAKVRNLSLRDDIAPVCHDLGNIIQYSAFNFYCPECNRELSQSLVSRDYSVQGDGHASPVYFSKNTRCVFQPGSGVWRCLTCGRETELPIPVHRMLDELLLPVFDALMEENKVERVKAHSNVRSKELDYWNRERTEIEKAYMEHLSKVFELQDELDRMRAEISGETCAIETMQDAIETYKGRQSDVMRKIEEDRVETNRKIERITREVLDRVDQVKTAEMDALCDELAVLSRAKRLEEERRDAVQREILSVQQEQSHLLEHGFSTMHRLQGAGLEMQQQQIELQGRACSLMRKGTAMQAAIARKQGINVHDNSILSFQRMEDSLTRLGGKIAGKSTFEIEEDVLKSRGL
jgi:hypothetical protein